MPRPAPDRAAGKHPARSDSRPEAGSGQRAAGPAVPQGSTVAAAPAAVRCHLPTRRPSLILPRKQSPAADGRLQTRINASVRDNFFDRRHRAPLSLDASCRFSLRGTLRALRAEATPSRAPRAAAASSPHPAATCPRAQGKAGGAGAPLPQTHSGHSFPLLFLSLFFFSKSPLG